MPRMQGNGTGNGGGEYFFIDWNLDSQNIAGNYSTISWAAYWHFNSSDRQLDNGYADLAGQRRWTNGGRIYNYAGNFTTRNLLLANSSFNVGHNSDGTLTIWVAGGVTGYSGQRSEAGANYGLPTIPRNATMTSHQGNFNDEQNPWVAFSNPGGFQVNVRLEFAGTVVAQRNNVGSTYYWTLTTSERNLLRSLTPNSATRSIRTVVATVRGGSEAAWDFRDNTFSIINGNPTFDNSQVSYLDTDATSVAITTDDQKIVQNRSNLNVGFTDAIALKSATIASYKVTLGTDVRTFTSAQSAINYATVDLAVDTPVSIEVTDSRGLKTTISKTVAILAWSLPTAVVNAGRVNNYEDTTNIKADVTIASVDGKNTITVLKVRYKKVADATYTEAAMTTSTVKVLTLDKLFEWNLEIVVADEFGTTTYVLLLPKGIPIMFMDVGKLSVGIGKFPSGTETLEIADEYMIPIMKKIHPIDILMTTFTNVNPGTRPELSGTTWVATGTASTNDSPVKTLYRWRRTA